MKLKNYSFKQLIKDIEEQILSLDEIASKHSLYYYEVLIVYNKLEILKNLKPKKVEIGYKNCSYYTEEELLSYNVLPNGLKDYSKEFRWQTLSIAEKEFYINFTKKLNPS